MNMARVVHFDITANEPEKLIDFYKGIFGWNFQKWDGPMDYWLIMTGKEGEPGIDGGLGKKGPEAMPFNTIEITDIDSYIEKVTNHGGKIIVPKMAIPKIGWIAYFEDPEGNKFGLMQNDPNAI